MKERALLGADVDECRLDTREHSFDLPEIDVTDHPLVLRTVHLQLN